MKNVIKIAGKAALNIVVSTTIDNVLVPVIFAPVAPVLLPVAMAFDVVKSVENAIETTEEKDTHEVKNVEYSVVKIEEEG